MLMILFVLWLLFNGHFAWDLTTLEISIAGLLIAGVIYLFAVFGMGYAPKTDWLLLRNSGLFIACIFVLLWEVLKANFHMIRVVLKRESEIHPVIVTVEVPLKKSFSRMLLSNYITLTPGTITIDQNNSAYKIHCLHPSMLDDYNHCVFVSLLRRMEK